jgi:hypothetical protein
VKNALGAMILCLLAATAAKAQSCREFNYHLADMTVAFQNCGSGADEDTVSLNDNADYRNDSGVTGHERIATNYTGGREARSVGIVVLDRHDRSRPRPE